MASRVFIETNVALAICGLQNIFYLPSPMFEISGNDITDLGDSDLRSLVVRLAIAELRAKGLPRSAVTAGGNQDAADGGIDVRIECPSVIADPDFVPRRLTGFQVKKPDMGRSAILKEMRPDGILRDAILDLADASGSYVIVSSQGSVADAPLADRRQAMRDALHDVASDTQLHTDFYDRERLAHWVNEYPGVAAWVRGRVGRPLAGWSSIGDWEGGSASAPKPYLSNDKACLIDERSRERKNLPITEGIAQLRAGLRIPKQCIRLIGLSGLGKTRLVQALFEEGVGEDPLDSSVAIYTDYSEETNPTARDMARELIASRQRAILVVDNCNPKTHGELARLCSSELSQVSLITVEYDVGEDEPEHTDVFRLHAASPELVTEWIKQSFPEISQVDREKIAEFSDGNFRVARALAETLGKGEALGSLKSRELFERIFHQRNEKDQRLLQCAEDLSLLYSIDGEDVSDTSELAIVGTIRGTGAQTLYEALAEMRKRGVVQVRGRFRAILPQAIANPLASHALERIPPTCFDEFCKKLTPRMLKSVSRRLGFLHDSVAAQAAVARWLRTDGPLGNLIEKGEEGFQIITSVAPVVPEAVLAKLEQELAGPNGARFIASSGRHQWIRLIKAIGYEADLFDRSVMLLTSFLVGEQESNNMSSGLNVFSQFFHIYLSGTQAAPAQRRAMIKHLAVSGDAHLIRCAHIALRALIKSGSFMSMSSYDFGARSRDWGWEPKLNQDVWDWYEEAINLVVELMPEPDARVLIASSIRNLWWSPSCRDVFNRIAKDFIQTRPWIEAWMACRETLRFDGKEMPADVRTHLEQFIKLLKPTDLLNQARAVVLSRMSGDGGWDFADGEDDEGKPIDAWHKANRMAGEVARALANNDNVDIRAVFLSELLVSAQAQRAFEFGRGLAEGADDLNTLWRELVNAYSAAEYQMRDATVLGGFICQAHQRDKNFTSRALEAAMDDVHLLPKLPYLQSRVSSDVEGIARLSRAISAGGLVAANFHAIANGSISGAPPEHLSALLEDIADLSDGVVVALEILHMYFLSQESRGDIQHEQLVSVGRSLLVRVDCKKNGGLRDYSVGQIIDICLVGENGREAAEKVCANISTSLDSWHISSYDIGATLTALFKAQPFIALDTFLLPTVVRRNFHLFDGHHGPKSPIESLDLSLLKKWANIDPDTRYPELGKCINMFASRDNDDDPNISPLFISLLELAPDKHLFMGDLWARLHPRSWSGSLASILIRRKAKLMKLVEHPDEQVRAVVINGMPELDRWIERERGRDRTSEESFE